MLQDTRTFKKSIEKKSDLVKKKLKPTAKQRKILQASGFDPNHWFVIKNLNDRLIVVSRFLNRAHKKIIWKERIS